MERNTGFEPATFALAIRKGGIPEPSRRSTPSPSRPFCSRQQQARFHESPMPHRRNTNLRVQLGSKTLCFLLRLRRRSSEYAPRRFTRSRDQRVGAVGEVSQWLRDLPGRSGLERGRTPEAARAEVRAGGDRRGPGVHRGAEARPQRCCERKQARAFCFGPARRTSAACASRTGPLV